MAGFNSRAFWDSVTQGYGLGEKIVGGLTKRHIGNKMAEINAMAPEELPQYEDGVAPGTKLYRMGDRTQETAFSPEEVQAYRAENAAKLFDSLGETDKANQYRMQHMQMAAQGLQNQKLREDQERNKRFTEAAKNMINFNAKLNGLDPSDQEGLVNLAHEAGMIYNKIPDGKSVAVNLGPDGQPRVSMFDDKSGQMIGQAPLTREALMQNMQQMFKTQLMSISPEMAAQMFRMDQDQANKDRDYALDSKKADATIQQQKISNAMEEAKFGLIKAKQAYDLDPNNPKTRADLEESQAKIRYYNSLAGKQGSRTSGGITPQDMATMTEKAMKVLETDPAFANAPTMERDRMVQSLLQKWGVPISGTQEPVLPKLSPTDSAAKQPGLLRQRIDEAAQSFDAINGLGGLRPAPSRSPTTKYDPVL